MAEHSVTLPLRVLRFLKKPAREKLQTLSFFWRSLFPAKPMAITLPFGSKWLAENSALDAGLRSGEFERAETSFVQRFLLPGMTVVDIGAHHGYYTLLASARVGKSGKVIAFEPSPRERRRLEGHVHLNKCSNVKIEPYALASEDKQAEFFLVEGSEDYCNSLRPPAVQADTHTVTVKVTSLDSYISSKGIEKVDFIKLDTEGAESEVLRGALRLLQSALRPLVLCEIAEIRTAPWGYSAWDIIHFMQHLNYTWFSIQPDGGLSEMKADQDIQDTNLVAVPNDRCGETLRTLGAN